MFNVYFDDTQNPSALIHLSGLEARRIWNKTFYSNKAMCALDYCVQRFLYYCYNHKFFWFKQPPQTPTAYMNHYCNHKFFRFKQGRALFHKRTQHSCNHRFFRFKQSHLRMLCKRNNCCNHKFFRFKQLFTSITCNNALLSLFQVAPLTARRKIIPATTHFCPFSSFFFSKPKKKYAHNG